MTAQQRINYICVRTQHDSLAWLKIQVFELFLNSKINKREYLNLLHSLRGRTQ
jgi:hypothetical protein